MTGEFGYSVIFALVFAAEIVFVYGVILVLMKLVEKVERVRNKW